MNLLGGHGGAGGVPGAIARLSKARCDEIFDRAFIAMVNECERVILEDADAGRVDGSDDDDDTDGGGDGAVVARRPTKKRRRFRRVGEAACNTVYKWVVDSKLYT